MAYQNLPRFEPNYGNRYGFRQRVSAPSTGPANIPIPGSPSAPPAPQTTGSSTRPSGDYHSGPSAESGGDDGSIDNAAGVRTDAALGQGHVIGQQTPGGIASGLLNLALPFGGFGLADKAGTALDEATGFGGIPEHERYGAAGTIDSVSGGVFDSSGRAFDPITGRGLNSYGSRGDFYGGSYIQGIKDNPFSIDSYLGDPDNAQSFTAANQARAAGSRAAHGFDAARLNERGIYGGQDDTGGGITPEEAARLAQHVGQTEYGFESHTVAPDTATNEAIQGKGYTGSGAAPAGSQFSSTGTFQSSHSSDDGGDHGPGGNPNSVSDDVTDDLADEDFGSYDDGGGGGGGK